MAMSSAERSVRYRAAHPGIGAASSARYRATHMEEVKAKGAAYMRKRRKENPEKERELAYRSNFKYRGYPEPTRPRPGMCECCGNLPNGKGVLHLDHCHVSTAFRGWLCSNCNTAIGKLGDSIAGLMKAVLYLERAAKETENVDVV